MHMMLMAFLRPVLDGDNDLVEVGPLIEPHPGNFFQSPNMLEYFIGEGLASPVSAPDSKDSGE
jgi:hypothetical protein